MTPDELRAIRILRYGSRASLARALGISASMVGDYEFGWHPVPRDVEHRLLTLTGKIGVPCPKCGRTITIPWFDGVCGGCTRLLSEDAETPRKQPAMATPSSPKAVTAVALSRDVTEPARTVSSGRASQPSDYSNTVTEDVR